MNWISILYPAILFVILTPGVLIQLPHRSSFYIQTIVHSVLFAILMSVMDYLVKSRNMEGYAKPKKLSKTPCFKQDPKDNNTTKTAKKYIKMPKCSCMKNYRGDDPCN